MNIGNYFSYNRRRKPNVVYQFCRFLCVISIIAMAPAGFAQTSGPDVLLQKLFNPPPNGSLQPQQVEAAIPFSQFLLIQKSINVFPFGLEQREHVRVNKIKAVTVDAFEIDSNGIPHPNVNYRQVARFDRVGRVVELTMSSGGNSVIRTFEYTDDILARITLNGTELARWDAAKRTFTYKSGKIESIVLGSEGRVASVHFANNNGSWTFSGNDTQPIAIDGVEYCSNPPETRSCFKTQGGNIVVLDKYRYVWTGRNKIQFFRHEFNWSNGDLERIDVGLKGETDIPAYDRKAAGYSVRNGEIAEVPVLGENWSFGVSEATWYFRVGSRGVLTPVASPKASPRWHHTYLTGSRKSLLVLNPLFTEYYD